MHSPRERDQELVMIPRRGLWKFFSLPEPLFCDFQAKNLDFRHLEYPYRKIGLPDPAFFLKRGLGDNFFCIEQFPDRQAGFFLNLGDK